MENYYGESWTESKRKSFIGTGKANAFLTQVYVTMAIGLSITGAAAWFFGNKLLAGEMAFLMQSPFIYIITFAPLAFVLALSFGIEKMSFQTASLVFGAYSLVNGVSLSFVFLVYTGASIAKVFFVTAGMFGIMSLAGMFTSKDLSKFGSMMFMGLIGLILATIVNFILQSEAFDYLISIAGVVIFLGLTAYDTQRLMQIGAHADTGDERIKKASVMGALALYLDFINLFLYLLRFFGRPQIRVDHSI